MISLPVTLLIYSLWAIPTTFRQKEWREMAVILFFDLIIFGMITLFYLGRPGAYLTDFIIKIVK